MLSPVQIQKRLSAADGFLQLRMPAEALQELAPVWDEEALRSLKPLTHLRGRAFIDLERYEEGRDQFRSILEHDPNDIEAAVNKGWCEKRLDMLPAAIRTMERAVRLHPDVALLQYNLACYHALAVDKDRCLTRLGVAIRLDRSFVEMIDDESDFDPLRQDADFNTLVQMATTA